MHEMGAVGDATVIAINPCPPIQSGIGTVVTGKFIHDSNAQTNVLRLRLEGQSEATGVTDNHPYWSADRQDFIPAGQLRIGELVDTDFGQRRVQSVQPWTGFNGLLYNLETLEHVYRVGSVGTLVHNAYAPTRELLHGSGPKPGFLEVSGRVKSTKAVQNFRGKTPADFRFDPENGRFVMGKGGIRGHDAIPGVSSKSPGGRIRFENGKLITDEWSGHYGDLWTPEIRSKFVEFMKSHGVDITHIPWGS